jgi:hypothetical protein
MRTKLILAVCAAASLAACGAAGGGKSAMVTKCVDGGEDRKVCTCVADEMEKTLDKEIFQAMLLEAEGKSEEAQKIMSALPLGKQLSAATGMMGVMAKCSAAK